MKDPYRRLAKIYDRFVEPANSGVRGYVLKRFPPQPGQCVLEIGCGTGTNLALYRQAGCTVFGLELSPSMLKQAKQKLAADAQLVQGDARFLPFASDSFDLVVAMLTIHEMPYQIRSAVIGEMVRVTQRGGRLVLTDYHFGRLRFPWGWVYKLVILFYEISAGKEHFRNYRHFLSHGGLQPLLDGQPVHLERRKIIAEGNMAVWSFRKE